MIESHHKMKGNLVKHKRSAKPFLIIGAFMLVAASIGIAMAYSKLHDLWIRQCVITDISTQISITDGKMVKADAILDAFGLRNGANLALIDFESKRSEILSRIPSIKSISVVRHLPNRATIMVEERRPFVRMGVSGKNVTTGRVADNDGVVFTCRRGTGMLPTLRERETETTKVGQRLSGHALAAIMALEICSDEEFSSLGVLEADVSKRDFILFTLGNYAQAKIAWDSMGNPSRNNLNGLTKRLSHLMKAIRSNVGSNVKMWNATDDSRIYADTKEIIQ